MLGARLGEESVIALYENPDDNLRAWVYQILFSVFVTRCRKSRRERNAMTVLSTDPCAWTMPDIDQLPKTLLTTLFSKWNGKS